MRTFVGVPWVNNPGLLYKTVASLTASAHLELDIRLVGNGPTLQDSIQARGMVNGFQLRKSTLPHQIQGVSWMPSLPSLAAVWNTLLVTAWTEGYDKAVLCNPDLQVHPESLDVLLKVQRDTDAMVCTGIAVDEMPKERPTGAVNPKGSGPSYSLFVITKLCHELYPFDPNFTPAYCVVPETPVLLADLRWVPIGKVHPGDRLVGVEETAARKTVRGQARRDFVVGEVISTHRRMAECLFIEMSDGRFVICSTDHKFLAKHPLPNNNPYTWRPAHSLRQGWRIFTPLDVWQQGQSFEEGWLSGIVDGEGNLRMTKENQCELVITQKEGVVLDRIFRELDILRLPYTWRARPDGVTSVEIAVRRHAVRALGNLRPVRMLPKFSWDGLSTFSRSGQADISIKAILPAGVREVVTLETTAGTYLTEGLVSHNCEDVDHHRRMLLGGDGRRSFAIDVPFFHVGSGTLNSMSEDQRAKTEQRITMGSRRYYAEKWGGPVNEEHYRTSFNLEAQDDGPRDGPTTTPDLFREAWNG